MTKRILKALAAVSLILLLFSASAYSAILVDIYQFTGEITDDFGNPFGLNVGDEIDGNTIFPNGVISGMGFEEFTIVDEGATVTFNVGPLQLTEADDPAALAFFSEGLLTGFDYLAYFTFDSQDYEFAMSFGSSAGETAFTIYDDFFDPVVEGNFLDLQGGLAGNTQVIPIPGTLILLGTGLAGLMGARRKFRKD